MDVHQNQRLAVLYSRVRKRTMKTVREDRYHRRYKQAIVDALFVIYRLALMPGDRKVLLIDHRGINMGFTRQNDINVERMIINYLNPHRGGYESRRRID